MRLQNYTAVCDELVKLREQNPGVKYIFYDSYPFVPDSE
mgnify:CR=1 FL=1